MIFLHVLCIASWYPCAGEPLLGSYFQEQFEALSRHGLRVTVLALDFRSLRKPRPWGLPCGTENGLSVYRLSVPLGPLGNGVFDKVIHLAYKYAYQRIISREGTLHLIHAHAISAGLMAEAISKWAKIPYIVTEHSSGTYQVLQDRAETARYRRVYNNSKKIIAVSEGLCSVIADIAQSPVDIRHIPNMVDFGKFRPITARRKHFTFVSIGNLIARKGFDILIAAFSRVNRKFPDTRLNIIGGGPEHSSYIRQCEDLNVGRYVVFPGKLSRDELAEHLPGCHCFVLASRAEPFGVVFAESLACGLPVIGTACDGPKSIINETNGLIVPVDDTDALAGAMERIYAHFSEYDSEKIRHDALKLYGTDEVSARIAELYGEVLETEWPGQA